MHSIARHLTLRRPAIVTLAAILFAASANAQEDRVVDVPTVGQPLYPGASVPQTISATLRLPNGTGPFAAVVLVHGSSGIDGRGAALAEQLRRVGIASLELDMWAPRGLRGGVNSRPRIISDTLPDAWGAWMYLAKQSQIDPKRIGIAGFSWGGAVAWITAFGLKPLNAPAEVQAARFAAHAPFYGGCTGYAPNGRGGKALASLGVKPTGAPVFYVIGSKDDYEASPQACTELAKAYPEANVKVRLFEGATHAFDGPSYGSYYDPSALDGKGNQIFAKSDSAAGDIARREVSEFFRAELSK